MALNAQIRGQRKKRLSNYISPHLPLLFYTHPIHAEIFAICWKLLYKNLSQSTQIPQIPPFAIAIHCPFIVLLLPPCPHAEICAICVICESYSTTPYKSFCKEGRFRQLAIATHCPFIVLLLPPCPHAEICAICVICESYSIPPYKFFYRECRPIHRITVLDLAGQPTTGRA